MQGGATQAMSGHIAEERVRGFRAVVGSLSQMTSRPFTPGCSTLLERRVDPIVKYSGIIHPWM